ncbi:MAG: hypothetical protein ABL984_16390 [Pyrinomonadaceae bacterium]
MKKFLNSLLISCLLANFGWANLVADVTHPLPQVVLTSPQSAVRNPQSQKLEPSKKSWDAAAKVVKKMTVDEKVGQLVHIGINARFANQQSPFFTTEPKSSDGFLTPCKKA